jgi:hypothetical protein
MLTKNEVSALTLSPTKKDFVQIWNELLEVASKLSERWDPTSTNESDPGIVILKALTGIADKLNYNIDKNILEAFMPTAAQEDSMRKLCDMLGYNMKYYRSAVTDVTIKYYNPEPSDDEYAAMNNYNGGLGIEIPKFTVITNGDQDVSYFTINQHPVYISASNSSRTITCMEGQIVKCESTNDNSVITAEQITDNRFYLPETQIAENGLFIYNVSTKKDGSTLVDGTQWESVSNLNTQARSTKVFKFGFDSYRSRPYVEFPDDYRELIDDGIFIYYTRTSGVNGNVSPRTLTQLELPTAEGWNSVSADSFSAENLTSATSGANAESIAQAYAGFKKTIGTFETLVTCRDYMNKIYSLTKSNTGTPLVSNVLVTDIRNDLNRAITICSCDGAGIFYKETSLTDDYILLDEASVLAPPKEEDSGYELVNTSTSPWAQNGEPSYSDYEIVYSDTVTKGSVIREANKPVYNPLPYMMDVGNALTGGPTTRRETCWRLGGKDGMPLFADKYYHFVKNYQNFNPNGDGEVVDTDQNGKASDVWYIIQDGRYFSTTLCIDRIEQKETIVKEQRTETIYEQRTETKQYQRTKTITNTEKQPAELKNRIDHFDLVLYPFKTYNQIKNNVKDIRAVYDASFGYAGTRTLNEIKDILDDSGVKTVAHNIKAPEHGDIVSINNYLRLSATIATNTKVTTDEGVLIKENIKIALANAFNMRELDFGEEIPFDRIVEVIESADANIKVASLNDPAMYTTFSVFDTSSGTPTIQEYAVASDWLDVAGADDTGRLTKKNVSTGKLESTFDTVYARELYNKLAVRNVLAGRVPLFDYNNTFTSSFTEVPYQVTERITNLTELPEDFIMPTKNNPYTIFTDSDSEITYVGRWTALTEKPEVLAEPTAQAPVTEVESDGVFYTGALEEDLPTYSQTVYMKVYTPAAFKDNVISGAVDEVGKPVDYITELVAECSVPADEHGVVADVTLESGEVIKFRAPNFVTTKTYPAYVNYHLKLANNKAIRTESRAAEAMSLYQLLNDDVAKAGTISNAKVNWQKVLDYFTSVDSAEGRTNTPDSYVKTFEIQQKVSAYKPADAGTEDKLSLGEIIINVNNYPMESSAYTPEALMAMSGCIKLTNDDFTARLDWADDDHPAGAVPMKPIKLGFNNPFITDINVVAYIKEAVQTTLDEYRGRVDADGNPILPTQGAWTVSFSFSCVPFEAGSLEEWCKFINSEYKNLSAGTDETREFLNNLIPQIETNVFWRKFGEGYDIGKYVTEDTAKLLPFTSSYFGLLPETRLRGIYIAKDLGADTVPFVIKNDTEYQLGEKEFLYIEYTPSTTTTEGTTQALPPVTEVYGQGTIFKPSGFEDGLNSSAYVLQSNTSAKTASFVTATGSSEQIQLLSLGASEQIELREPAAVKLTRDSFSGSSKIYIYKNFNDCPELEIKEEEIDENGNKKRINNSYILKDGEYIFYTDQNKAEPAYFTSGTQVTLHGNITLPQYDIIELSDIFGAGLQNLMDNHMTSLTFDTADDKLEFQEYQYVTLTAGDTLSGLVLTAPKDGSTSGNGIDSTWKFCSEAELAFAEDPDTAQVLPDISVNGRDGNGWEVCSTMALAVSPNYAQTLRSTPKINTKLRLVRTKTDGGAVPGEVLDPSEFGENSKLSFKTNLDCIACGNKISIDDVLSNPDNLKSFQLKVFTADAPAMYDTKPGTVIPLNETDLLLRKSDNILRKTDSKDLWYKKDLEELRASTTADKPDKALQLSVGLQPDTYGIFSVYLDFKSSNNMSAWIEVLPGTSPNDITLLNVAEPVWESKSIGQDSSNKLIHKLMLNPGINCVKVAKNCRFFIKASANAQGTLMFDELRLVNSKTIRYTYTDTNGETATQKTVTQKTHGLNLAQLGYLDASNASDPAELARDSLKNAFVEQALADIRAEGQRAYQDFSKKRSEVLARKSDVTLAVNVENAINADLALLNRIDDKSKTRRAALIDVYNKVSKSLSNEKALLAALDGNTKVKDLEQQLAIILEGLAPTDSTKQQILESWVELYSEIQTIARELPDAVILEDFEKSSHHFDQTDVLPEIKKLTTEKINKQYDEQLAGLANAFEQVTNSADGVRLCTLLRARQAEENSAAWESIRSKAAELISITSVDLDGLIESMVIAANTPEPVQLLAILTQLRNTLDSNNVAALASEIAQAAEESNDRLLAELIAPLFKYSEETGKYVINLDDITKSTILNLIDTAYKNTQGYIAETKDQQTVIDAVEAVKNQISEEYKTSLTKAFETIKTILETISEEATSEETTISALIDGLEASEDNRVYDILDQVKQAIENRKNYLSACSELSFSNAWQTTACIAFVEESILDMWPELLCTRLAEVLAEIDIAFCQVATTSDADIFTQRRAEIAERLNHEKDNRVTEPLLLSISANRILTLFDKFKNTVDIDGQNMADAQLISSISALMPESSELASALEANNNDTLVISTLIEKYKNAANVSQKQKILTILRDKLTDRISTNQQLFDIISALLWPNYTSELKLNSTVLTDSFFEKLCEVIEAAKTKILEGDTAQDVIVDSNYLALIAHTPEEFEEALLTFAVTNSCLPDNYLEAITATKALLVYSDKVKTEADSLSGISLKTSVDVKEAIEDLEDISDFTEDILADLICELEDLESGIAIDTNYTEAYKVLLLEEQLLAEIRKNDKNREFYYNVPIEDSLAIDFNEADDNFNTLMSPAIYYDVNNINNSFVISKLDINYLSSGIQIARSSRYN